MIVPDVNLLVYAYNAADPRHPAARSWLAALTVEHQAELRSCDGDFSRFSGLRWRNPIRETPA